MRLLSIGRICRRRGSWQAEPHRCSSKEVLATYNWTIPRATSKPCNHRQLCSRRCNTSSKIGPNEGSRPPQGWDPSSKVRSRQKESTICSKRCRGLPSSMKTSKSWTETRLMPWPACIVLVLRKIPDNQRYQGGATSRGNGSLGSCRPCRTSTLLQRRVAKRNNEPLSVCQCSFFTS